MAECIAVTLRINELEFGGLNSYYNNMTPGKALNLEQQATNLNV